MKKLFWISAVLSLVMLVAAVLCCLEPWEDSCSGVPSTSAGEKGATDGTLYGTEPSSQESQRPSLPYGTLPDFPRPDPSQPDIPPPSPVEPEQEIR